jgi:hypothetical protein
MAPRPVDFRNLGVTPNRQCGAGSFDDDSSGTNEKGLVVNTLIAHTRINERYRLPFSAEPVVYRLL